MLHALYHENLLYSMMNCWLLGVQLNLCSLIQPYFPTNANSTWTLPSTGTPTSVKPPTSSAGTPAPNNHHHHHHNNSTNNGTGGSSSGSGAGGGGSGHPQLPSRPPSSNTGHDSDGEKSDQDLVVDVNEVSHCFTFFSNIVQNCL